MLNILSMYLLIHLLYIRCLCAQAVVMEGCSAIQTIQRFGTAQSHLLLHRTVKRTVLLSLREQGDGEKTIITSTAYNIATLDFYMISVQQI